MTLADPVGNAPPPAFRSSSRKLRCFHAHPASSLPRRPACECVKTAQFSCTPPRLLHTPPGQFAKTSGFRELVQPVVGSASTHPCRQCCADGPGGSVFMHSAGQSLAPGRERRGRGRAGVAASPQCRGRRATRRHSRLSGWRVRGSPSWECHRPTSRHSLPDTPCGKRYVPVPGSRVIWPRAGRRRRGRPRSQR